MDAKEIERRLREAASRSGGSLLQAADAALEECRVAGWDLDELLSVAVRGDEIKGTLAELVRYYARRGQRAAVEAAVKPWREKAERAEKNYDTVSRMHKQMVGVAVERAKRISALEAELAAYKKLQGETMDHVRDNAKAARELAELREHVDRFPVAVNGWFQQNLTEFVVGARGFEEWMIKLRALLHLTKDTPDASQD